MFSKINNKQLRKRLFIGLLICCAAVCIISAVIALAHRADVIATVEKQVTMAYTPEPLSAEEIPQAINTILPSGSLNISEESAECKSLLGYFSIPGQVVKVQSYYSKPMLHLSLPCSSSEDAYALQDSTGTLATFFMYNPDISAVYLDITVSGCPFFKHLYVNNETPTRYVMYSALSLEETPLDQTPLGEMLQSEYGSRILHFSDTAEGVYVNLLYPSTDFTTECIDLFSNIADYLRENSRDCQLQIAYQGSVFASGWITTTELFSLNMPTQQLVSYYKLKYYSMLNCFSGAVLQKTNELLDTE